MRHEKQRGFVIVDLLTVFVIFSTFCLIVALTVGQVLQLPLPKRLLIALVFSIVGIAFVVGGSVMSERRRRAGLPKRRKACLAFVDGQLTYFINRNYRRVLLLFFYFNYAAARYYHDFPMRTDFYPALTGIFDWVKYTVPNVIKDDNKMEALQHFPLGYRADYPLYRVSFYVTKTEFKEAFLAVQSLGRKPRDGSPSLTETVIFGNVRVVLIEDRAFGRVEYPLSGSDPMTRLQLKP